MNAIKMDRRSVLQWGLASTLGQTGLVQAQKAEPLSSARIVLGFPAGSSADVACRLFAQGLQGHYAHSVIVENKAGAAGRIGVAELMNAPADGGTLLLTPTSVLTLYPSIYKRLTYNPETDLLPLTRAATTTFALCVGPAVPEAVGTLPQFLTWCRQNPKLAAYGSPGAGSSPHFLGAMLARQADVAMVHVPYKGTSAAVNDLLGGQVPAVMVSPGNVKAHVATRRVRVLAVTSAQRWPMLASVPTMAELGFGQATNSEAFAFFARKGTPPDTVDRLASALRAVARHPDVIAKLAEHDLLVESNSPAELMALLQQDRARWQSVVRTVGFTPED